MLKIVIAPNPVLSKKAEEVVLKNGEIDESILALIEEMKKTLESTKDPEGVGLAAPQIGKSLRIFIAKQSKKRPFEVFINPVIIQKDEKLKTPARSLQCSVARANKQLEGCLSLPTIWGNVKRKPKLTVSYYDETAKFHTRKISGFLATIFQHEMDHLNGTLFPKRVLEQKEVLYKSQKNAKGEDIFEEINI